ncbi:hypothetical protein [Clostridium sp. LP20]|uniref:hypothetical protein n=1 Tax=Clostridium sp. LP20 TaxID=3418665 RepID=UPI003EE4CE1D
MIFYILLIKKIDQEFLQDNNIIGFFIKCVVLTLVLSIIYYLIGRDAVYLVNGEISFTAQGGYTDKRLTWIFGHKSSYSLMILMFTGIVIKYKQEIKRHKSILILLAVVCVLTNSKTALPFIIALVGYDLICNSKNKNLIIRMIKVIIIPILFIVGSSIIIKSLAESRDITSLGSRTYIYDAAKLNLSIMPHGIGDKFGEMMFTTQVFPVDNFHNIFLNEMLVFGVGVGVAYFLLFTTIGISNIGTNGLSSLILWTGIFTLFFMDYSLRTDILSLFLFLTYLLSVKKKSGNIEYCEVADECIT